jgi:hypothetical protein
MAFMPVVMHHVFLCRLEIQKPWAESRYHSMAPAILCAFTFRVTSHDAYGDTRVSGVSNFDQWQTIRRF